ncbi:MAG: hypothetical protein NVSMB3_01680 [Acidobacteriaceae bacterium]
MLDAKRGTDETGVFESALFVLLERLLDLLDATFHAAAMLSGGLFAEVLEDLAQTQDLALGLVEVITEELLHFGIAATFYGLRKRFDQLIFGAVEVA